MSNLIKKSQLALKEGRFFKTIYNKILPYIKGLYFFLNFKKINIKLVVPSFNEIDKSDSELADRIFKSYKKMKEDQINIDNIYKPSSLWQEHIEKDFGYLVKSYKEKNIDNFLYFLQNFGNWENYLGIENQTFIKKYNKNIFLRKYLTDEIFSKQRKIWEYFNQGVNNISVLNMPKYGNHNGAMIEKNFVVLGSFFNEIYASIISKYLKKNDRNVIMEIGAGYGRLAYYTLNKLKNFTYVDFDIPETLILASFFLSKCYPNKKTLFYGETDLNNVHLKEYDLIFLPNWEIKKIQNNEVDFTINKNSLGEMNSDAAYNYIEHINRVSKYFFSMNHEFYRNKFSSNLRSLINKEFNNKGKFKELMRYPDLGHLTFDNDKINFETDIFFYIYEKIKE